MPNTKSCEKRIRQSEKRNSKNSQIKSSVRTAAKKIQKAVDSGKDKDSLTALLKDFTKTIDTASGKRIVHKKTASRKKSRLAKKINKSISAAQQQ